MPLTLKSGTYCLLAWDKALKWSIDGEFTTWSYQTISFAGVNNVPLAKERRCGQRAFAPLVQEGTMTFWIKQKTMTPVIASSDKTWVFHAEGSFVIKSA